MAIQNRRGADADFDASKMLPAELAITTDGSRKVYAAFAPGDVKELASKEDVQEIVDEFDASVTEDIQKATEEITKEATEQKQAIKEKAEEILADVPNYEQRLAELEAYKANAILSKSTGKTNSITDAAPVPPLNIIPYGKSTQKTYEGNQLFNVNDVKTSLYGTIDNEGYITFEYDNTQGTSSVYPRLLINKSNLLKPNTSYLLVTEVVELSDVFMLAMISTSSTSQFKETIQVGTGLSTGTRVDVVTTLEDFGECECVLRCGATIGAGKIGKIKFRLSIIEDTTVTADTFVYEPFVGGEASPNINYPQSVVGIGQRLLSGNQLFDIDSGVENEYFFPSPDTQTQSPNIKVLYISVKPKTKYYVSSVVGSGSMRIAELTSDKVFVNRTTLSEGQTKCIETRENVAYLQIAYEKTFTKCMINEGASALPWEPYTGGKEQIYNVGSIEQRLLTSNLLNPKACNRNFPFGIPNNTTFLWVETDVDLVQGKTYYTGFSINGVYGHYTHYINYDVSSSSQGLVTKVTDGIFVAKRSGKLHFRTDATNDATIDNLFVSEVYVEEFKPYSEQPLTYQTPNGFHGIPLGKTIPSVIANSPIHMRGVYWDSVKQQYYIGNTKNENGEDVQRILEVELNGTENIGMRTEAHVGETHLFQIYLNSATPPIQHDLIYTETENFVVLCNSYIHNKGAWSNDEKGIYLKYNNQLWIRDSFSSADEMKAKLKELYDAGTPVIVYAILQNPIVTDTSEEELAQFNALRMNYPNTTIVNDANAHMEVEYVADTKCYIDKKFEELQANITSAVAQLL